MITTFSTESTLMRGVEKSSRVNDPLWKSAQHLESGFIAEMLGHAGFQSSSSSFDGGIGEAQFSSFLREVQISMIVKQERFGIAEMIFHSLNYTAKANE